MIELGFALHFAPKELIYIKKFRIVLVVLVILIIAGAGAFIYINGRLKVLSVTAVEDVDLAAVADGVYTGGYSSFPVSAKVEVSVLDHRITQIRLLEHVNGKGGAAESIPSIVVDAQSLKVETISGATYSSKVILLAIADALKKGL